MFGNVFYRQFPYKMVTHARVFSLKPNFKITQKQGLFIANSLQFFKYRFGYENMCLWSKIKDEEIFLPVQNNEIDFDFMEEFISELQGYLRVTGLSNYTLNEKEKSAIARLNEIEWSKFSIVGLFNVRNTRNILSRDIIENSGTIPYLSASRENNAVSSYISYDKECLEKGNCIFIGGKTFVVTYQEQDFYSNDSHNLSLYLKDNEGKVKLSQLFMVSCIYKSLIGKYSWGDSISNKKIQSDYVYLPLINNAPDYQFMRVFISAIQKLVIEDLVKYADREIMGYQQVISS